jgi:hypothetical protein
MAQHSELSADRWSRFTLDQQILMIANEMNRAAKLTAADDRQRLVNAYERVLRLTDLTVEVHERPALRRELLRWRDLVAQLYITPAIDTSRHGAALRCLLRFTAVASRQLAHLNPVAAASR